MLTRTQALEGGANVTCISKVQFTYRLIHPVNHFGPLRYNTVLANPNYYTHYTPPCSSSSGSSMSSSGSSSSRSSGSSSSSGGSSSSGSSMSSSCSGMSSSSSGSSSSGGSSSNGSSSSKLHRALSTICLNYPTSPPLHHGQTSTSQATHAAAQKSIPCHSRLENSRKCP